MPQTRQHCRHSVAFILLVLLFSFWMKSHCLLVSDGNLYLLSKRTIATRFTIATFIPQTFKVLHLHMLIFGLVQSKDSTQLVCLVL